MSNWNDPAQFQYDSADLPFLPPTATESGTGSLESSTPFWKVNSITEVEKSFTSPEYLTNKPLFRSPFMKLLDANSRSHENISELDPSNFSQLSASAPPQITTEQRRRLSQSLPATPLATPGQTPLTTPGQTPLTTPNPTPQSSPSVQRKAEMEAVSKAAIRCGNRLAQGQQQQHQKQSQMDHHMLTQNRWFYLGFMPHANSIVGAATAAASGVGLGQLRGQLTSDASAAGDLEKNRASDVTVSENKVPSSDPGSSGKQAPMTVVDGSTGKAQSEFSANRNYRRKCGFSMTNRDINFLAPTSM